MQENPLLCIVRVVYKGWGIWIGLEYGLGHGLGQLWFGGPYSCVG